MTKIDVSLSENLPRVVRRNTILLSTGQVVLTTSTQITAIIGALATFQPSGDPSLSGLVFSLTWAGRILISYASGFFSARAALPFGRMADRNGAKKIMIVGAMVTGFGGLITPLSTDYFVETFGIFLVGLG